jgi:hypothetical protein
MPTYRCDTQGMGVNVGADQMQMPVVNIRQPDVFQESDLFPIAKEVTFSDGYLTDQIFQFRRRGRVTQEAFEEFLFSRVTESLACTT